MTVIKCSSGLGADHCQHPLPWRPLDTPYPHPGYDGFPLSSLSFSVPTLSFPGDYLPSPILHPTFQLPPQPLTRLIWSLLQNVGGEGSSKRTLLSWPGAEFPPTLCLAAQTRPFIPSSACLSLTSQIPWSGEEARRQTLITGSMRTVVQSHRLDPAHWPRMAVWFAGCLATPME